MGNPNADYSSKSPQLSARADFLYTELQLSDNCNIIATEQLWLEGSAKTQLKFVSQMADMVRVSGMPDLHPGKDAPIGAAFLTRNRLYPALVGSDIGCGIALWQTSLPTHKASLSKLVKKLGNIDHPLGECWHELIAERQQALQLANSPFDKSLGTIGGGNHFAEITQLEKVDQQLAEKYELQEKQIHLLIHSGSRGLGAEIFRTHAFRAGHTGIVYPSEAAESYLVAHEQAVKFAYLNRELIAHRMLDQLGLTGHELLSVHHNFMQEVPYTTEQNGSYFLHRKGAAPADHGLVVIAGSRGSYSYLVEPRTQHKSLYSIAHGAGRKWARGMCQAKLAKRYTHWRELAKTSFGSKVICENKQLAYEEAPEAYKSIDSVIESLQAAHLIKVVARLRPLVTYKTQESR